MFKRSLVLAVLVAVWSPLVATAQVPQLINYQGRVAVGSVNFDGAGQFKFALVNTGRSYIVQYNDALVAGGWQALTGFTQADSGATRTITDNAAPGARRFYRVVVTSP